MDDTPAPTPDEARAQLHAYIESCDDTRVLMLWQLVYWSSWPAQSWWWSEEGGGDEAPEHTREVPMEQTHTPVQETPLARAPRPPAGSSP
jgi:hypothetical protein